jgi:hypothetical protein
VNPLWTPGQDHQHRGRIERRPDYAPAMAWANFHKIVFYGMARWPSACEWIVPGTITDLERI